MDDTQIYAKGVRVATEAELEATSTEIDERITEEVSTLNETINTLDENINDRIDTEVSTLNDTITQLDSDINARIDTEVSTLNDRIDTEVDTLNDRIDDLETDTGAAIDHLQDEIGDLSQLNTVDKSNLVNAVDEVNNTFANYLSKTNTVTYIPTANFHPSTKKYVDDAIAAIRQLHFEIVQQLPQVGDPTIIYMLLQSPGLGQDDYYDEYIYINNSWEKIGSTRINLSNYLAKDNRTLYVPTEDYNPSTKKYVDDWVDSLSDNLDDLRSDLEGDISNLRTDMEDADAALRSDMENADADLQNNIDEINNKFYEGISEEWDTFTEDEKEAFWLALVETYVELSVADTYYVQSTVGDNETIESDMYEDEAMLLTEQIIGG